jgi:large subunit ribosomal protein L29
MQIYQEEAQVTAMKAQQFREMSLDELEDRLIELEKHLFSLRAQAVTEKLGDSKSVINTRRDIARIKTVLVERKRKQADVGR